MINSSDAQKPPDRPEFLGIRVEDGGHPVAAIRAHGEELQFDDVDEADQFASAAQVMAAQLHIAHDRNHINGTTGDCGGPA